MNTVDRLEAELAEAMRCHGETDVRTFQARNALAAELAQQDHEAAAALLAENLTVSEQVLGLRDPATVQFRTALAEALRSLGRHKDALPLLRFNVDALSETLGTTNTQTVTTCYWLGDSLRQAGLNGEALNWLRRVEHDAISIGDAQLAIQARNGLAIVLEEQGHTDEALALFERNLGEAEQLAPQSVLTWAIRDNLADTYDRAGRFDDAVRLYRRTYADRSDSETAGSPSLVLAAWNLAASLHRSGAESEAMQLLTTAADEATASRGEGDRVSLSAWARVAFLLRSKEEFRPAHEIYERIVPIATVSLGEDDRDTLSYRNQRAICLSGLGEVTIAASEYSAVLEKATAHLGEADQDTCTFRRNAAQLMLDGGWYDEALPLLEANATLSERSTEIPNEDKTSYREAFLQACRVAEEPETAVAWLEPRLQPASDPTQEHLLELAHFYWAADRRGDALTVWRKVLDDAERGAEPDGDTALVVRSILIDAFSQQERFNDAADLAIRQLSAVDRRYPAEHIEVCRALGVAVDSSLRATELVAALPLLERLQADLLQRFGHRDERVHRRRIMTNLVRARVHPDQRSQARDELKVILADLGREFGACQSSVYAHRGLGEVCAAMGDLAQAKKHCAAAVADARIALGPYAPGTLSALYELATVEVAMDDPHATESLRQLVRDGNSLNDHPTNAEKLGRARALLRQRGEKIPDSDEATKDPEGLLIRPRRRLAAVIRDHGAGSREAVWERIILGDKLRTMSLMAEAKRAYAEAEASSGGEIEARLVAANRHAMVIEAVGDKWQALNEYERNLLDGEAHLGSEHALTDLLRHNLADAYETLGRLDAAHWHFGHNVRSLRARLGDADAQTIDTRRRLAWTALLADRRETAFFLARRAYQDAVAHLAPGSDTLLAVRNVLAMCRESLGDLDTAQALYEQNLVEGETSLGERDSTVVALRNNLARLYRDRGRLDEALTLYEKSASVTASDQDERRVEVLADLGLARMLSGDLEVAQVVFCQSKDVALDLGGPTSDLASIATKRWAETVIASDNVEDHIADYQLQLAAGDDEQTVALELSALLSAHGDKAEAAKIRACYDLNSEEETASGELLLLAYAMEHSDDQQNSEELIAERLNELADSGLWPSREAVMLVALLEEHYRRDNRWQDLAELVERDVTELSQALGEGHPRTRAARMARADLLRQMGARKEAVTLLETELQLLGTRLREDDPARLELLTLISAARRSAERLERRPMRAENCDRAEE